MPIVDLPSLAPSAPVDVPRGLAVTPGALPLPGPLAFPEGVYDTDAGQRAQKSLWDAVSEQKNMLVSLAAAETFGLDRTPDPGFDAWEAIKGSRYEPYWDRFADAANRPHADAIKRQIDREEENRNIIEAAPLWQSMPLIFGAEVLDPTILIPGGAFVRGAKGGLSVLRSALNVGAATAAAVAVQEAGLQATQQTRTLTESAINVSASALLGGLLGAGGSALLSRAEWNKAVRGIEREARESFAQPTVPDIAATAPASVKPQFIETRGGTRRFHGSSSEEVRPSSTHFSTLNYYGQGFYTTDAADIAFGYSRRGAKQSGQRNVFEVRENRQLNIYDAEAPIDETLEVAIRQSAESVEIAPGHRFQTDLDNIILDVLDEKPRNLRDFYDKMRDAATREGFAANDIQEVFTGVSELLRARGFAGLVHKGGLRTKSPEHQVTIYFNPEEDITIQRVPLEELQAAPPPSQPELPGVAPAGAAATTGPTLEQLTVAGTSAAFVSRLFARMNPGQRLIWSPNVESRFVSLNLAEFTLHLRGAEEGLPTPQAAETLRKQWDAGLMEAVATQTDSFSAYKKSGGNLTKQQFHEQVGIAAFRNDEHAIPEIAAAAKAWRSKVVDPLLKEAQEMGQIPADVIVETAPSYFSRYPNRSKIIAQEHEFKREVAEYIIESAPRWKEDFEIAAANRLAEAQEKVANASAEGRGQGAPPTPPPGTARMYHGQLAPINRVRSPDEGMWFTSNLEDARGWAGKDGKIFYVDVPENKLAWIPKGTDEAPLRTEISMDIAKGRKLLSGEDAAGKGKAREAAERALRDVETEIRLEREAKFGDDTWTRQRAAEIADEVYDHYTLRGWSGKGRPDQFRVSARGPMLGRTFMMPDEQLHKWMHTDANLVWRRYHHMMSTDIELARLDKKLGGEGDPELPAAFARIRAGSDRLRAETTDEKKLTALRKREKQDMDDIAAIRDIMRGTFDLAAWERNLGKIARHATLINYIRQMGQVALVSLPEVYRTAMVHGLAPTMGASMSALRGLRGFKMSVAQSKKGGNVSERALSHRIVQIADLNNHFAARGPVENMLANLAEVASTWNGIRLFTDGVKMIASVVTQDRILRTARNFAKAGKTDRRYMAFVGIDEAMAARIAGKFDEFGEVVDGHYVANTERWVRDGVSDAERALDRDAVRAYYAALNKDIDTIVIMRSVADIPVFANTPLGKVAFQFNAFNLASHQRILLRGLQENQTRFLTSVSAMVSLGMLVTYLQALSANRLDALPDFEENPGWWIAEGLDRSGVAMLPIQIANLFELATGINPVKAPITAFDETAAGSARLRNRNIASVLGPSMGLAEDIRTVATIPGRLMAGEDVTRGQKNAGERLIPFNSYVGMRQMLRWVINAD